MKSRAAESVGHNKMVIILGSETWVICSTVAVPRTDGDSMSSLPSGFWTPSQLSQAIVPLKCPRKESWGDGSELRAWLLLQRTCVGFPAHCPSGSRVSPAVCLPPVGRLSPFACISVSISFPKHRDSSKNTDSVSRFVRFLQCLWR